MNPVDGRGVGVEPSGAVTVGQLAEQAAEAVRALNHLTRPGADALTDPADASELVAALACTCQRLPQLLDQLTGWLRGEQQAGRLRADTCSPFPDTATAITAAAGCLTQASQAAHQVGTALDATHQALAHLALTAGGQS
jgi:hypothetical protein